ncbi:MAG: class I SAM-dependent methyltransferase [Phycisphaerae bacterium]|nr:class I SAM-dependent methyltransferase [Phycisphaerae bacterium]MDW8261518.1 class I SAM-dependent methyltransferase [Phycisphaerales bacterium]
MKLRSGIPSAAELDQLIESPTYRQYTEYNRSFLQKHSTALARYGRHWGQDPFGLWSRRWEYPFVGQSILSFAREHPLQPLTILDAGSGVTFFDYWICDQLPHARVVCVDYDRSYQQIFDTINAATPGSRVSFVEASLQDLPHADGQFDCLACLSVLEHTDNYGRIVREFARVLRRGGLLALTFDLSLDGRFPLTKAQASDLLAHVAEHFHFEGIDAQAELDKMDSPAGLLTTDHVKETSPQLLPWRFPLLKGVHDLLTGHGWTGGFRSKAVFCLDARRK